MAFLRPSRFTEFFINENGLDGLGFGWLLAPGMLFGAANRWWGDRGGRERLHEGLDLCYYRDGQGWVFGLDEGCRISVLYDGMVAAVVDDFLGRSLIVRHRAPEGEFCTIYGHTVPAVRAGDAVREGEIIARVADAAASRSGAVPHLHLSAGRATGAVAYERLDWDCIGDLGVMALVDPLPAIGSACVVDDVPLVTAPLGVGGC